MLRYLLLLSPLVFSSIALGCSGVVTARYSPGDVAEAEAETLALPKPEDLATAIQALIEAHRSCRFDGTLAERIQQPPATREEIEHSPAQYCLGELTLVRQEREDEDLIAMYLIPAAGNRTDETEVYVVFARLLDSKWLLTWPTPLGPPLQS